MTDDSWKSSTGPILTSTIYDGEKYDARKEMEGWNKTGFDDSSWKGTVAVDQSMDILVGAQGEPVIKNEEIKPIKIWTNDKGELIAIDFGCIKKVPEEFYVPYFELAEEGAINDAAFFEQKLIELEILKDTDTPKEREFFTELFTEMLSLFTQPFHQEVFDFSDPEFFGNIAALGEKYSKDTDLRKMNGNRGSKHFLYINRTFFGLYNLLNDLGSTVRIKNFEAFA